MSVYYEAIQSGRLTDVDIRNASASPRRALKKLKRYEAETRNARTPWERTKAYRRELERLEARVTKREAAARAVVRHG